MFASAPALACGAALYLLAHDGAGASPAAALALGLAGVVAFSWWWSGQAFRAVGSGERSGTTDRRRA